MRNILRSFIIHSDETEKDDRARTAEITRYALMAVFAVVVLVAMPRKAEAQAAPPTGAARFDIGRLLDPTFDADGDGTPDRLMTGHDPMPELGGGGQNPPLFFCEDAPDTDPLGLDLDSPSIAFQLAKQVHGRARSCAGLTAQRLEHLGQIQLLMGQYLALGGGDPNKIPGSLKTRYETLKFVFDLNEPLNRELQAKWGEIAMRAQALRALVRQAVTAERQAGLNLRRCAVLLPDVDSDIVAQRQVTPMTDQPDYVDYSGHVPPQFTLEEHNCATGVGPSPTKSSVLETARFFIRMAQAYLKASMQREEAYHQAAFRASKVPALRARLEGIARSGRNHNNALRTLWARIVSDVQALEGLIRAAERFEAEGAKKIHRCKRG